MAFKLPFKITPHTVITFLSLLLNLLGGTGTIEPLVGGHPAPAHVAAPAP